MIHIDTSGVDAFCKEALLELARLDREISAAYYDWTKTVFEGVVQRSPQWSGDMTANWNYSVGSPDMSYTMLENKAAGPKRQKRLAVGKVVYKMGAQPATGIALARMSEVTQPSWRDTVFITNATPIAPDVEAQTIYIRPVNLIQGQVAMINYAIMTESQRGLI